MKVGDLGEFGLIERLRQQVEAARLPAGHLRLGIGDDAAVWEPAAGLELCTTDTLLEGVHFRLPACPTRDLGWKALAVNLSDIAAMGGHPRYALVTLGLSPDTDVHDVDELYAGLIEAAACYGVALVGGDIVRAPQMLVSVSLTGEMEPGEEPLERSAARAGDAVAVTGALGASAAGLRLLLGEAEAAAEAAKALRAAHLRPQPRLAEGRALLAAGVRCAVDVSDGLTSDLARICEASGVGARLEAAAVPVAQAARSVWPQEALSLALGGGEDYELLFTCAPGVLTSLAGRMGVPVTRIGSISEGPPQVSVVDAEGRGLRLDSAGWDHLAPGRSTQREDWTRHRGAS